MRRFYFCFCLILIVGFLFRALNAERIYIVVDKAKLKKSFMAMPPLSFTGAERQTADDGEQLRKIVQDDLDFSGLFSFIAPTDMTPFESGGYSLEKINFKEWNALGAEFLIQGGYKLSDRRLIFEVKLYDVQSARLIVGKTYKALRTDLRLVSHKFSDAVIKALTGKKGIFQTKILFVSDKTGFKELYKMDYDGQNIEKLTDYESIVLSPAWAPDGEKVSFSSYETHKNHIQNVDLSVLDLSTKKRQIISRRQGLNSGSSWSPDGEDIAVTMSFEGNPEIYLIGPDGTNPRRLTHHPAIDVESAWSPDGQKIMYSSGKAPFAHLYMMKRDGSDQQRFTFAGRYNAVPCWSPDGDTVVFAGQKGGTFDLYLLDVSKSGLRRLTKSGHLKHNEHPSFSPDGRHIVFSSKRSGNYELYVIYADGSEERPLLQNFGNITFPKWSPYLN